MKAITLLLLCINLGLFAQPVQLNQYDAAGKKHGKWILYLNQDWEKVKDSISGLYIRYTWYDHGTNLYPMGSCGGKNYRLEIKANTEQKDGYQLLDGEYTWYDAKGRLSSVHLFKNGEYISCKEYYPTGTLHQHFDYRKKCEGQDQGWHVDIYDRKGELTLQSSMCKDKNGNWPLTSD